jgi:hypothetical protein
MIRLDRNGVGKSDLLQVVADDRDGEAFEAAVGIFVGDIPIGDTSKDRYLVAATTLAAVQFTAGFRPAAPALPAVAKLGK